MYEYQTVVKEDVKEYICENYSADEIRENLETRSARSDFEEKLKDILWFEDSVTGNASGSYTFNIWQAEENLCHNLDLLEKACNEFGQGVGETIALGAEYCDVTIRCYLLSNAISEALDEIEEEKRIKSRRPVGINAGK